jgi:hypothetical protein
MLCAAPVAIHVELWTRPLFCYKRDILVLRDIIYVINMLSLGHLVIYEHFMSVCVEYPRAHMR